MSVRISARRAFCTHIMFSLLKHISSVERDPTYIQRNERNTDRVDRSRVSLTPSMSRSRAGAGAGAGAEAGARARARVRARARTAISFSISVDLPGLIDNRTTDTPDARRSPLAAITAKRTKNQLRPLEPFHNVIDSG